MSAVFRRFQARDGPGQDGSCAYEKVKGETPNVFMYAQFAWYEWFHYKDSDGDPKLEYGSEWLRIMAQVVATVC